jgi:hypothetical protein
VNHLVLLGDSILDNKSYVGGGLDVVSHLREQMPDGWKATLRALDGSIVRNVQRQTLDLPARASHLFVSVGGNDALQNIDVLQMKVSSSAEVFNRLADLAGAFERQYGEMLQTVLSLNKPTTVCTIYYPRIPEEFAQKIAVAALSTFNDVIIKQAFMSGVPLIDLRLVCDEDSDYANSIEPSEAGGGKIAKTILRVVNEHNFERRKTEVFF